MVEIWKDIDGYENLYQVSNIGRVKSLETTKGKGAGNYAREERILKMGKARGYYRVALCNKGEIQQFSVHRIVAQAFIENPNKLPQVNHKDENKLNNHVDNLEWCTQRENLNYGTRAERIGFFHSKPVIQKTMQGEVIKENRSIVTGKQIGRAHV